MTWAKSAFVLLVVCFAFAAGTTKKNVTEQRKGKLFSLFNVVQFQNEGCRTDSAITGGHRNGTCFTSEECNDKGGTKAGNCASGFGVCCLFTINKCGDEVNQNCTYIRNPGFPSALTTDTSTCSHNVKKCADDVCQFRLDFESFTLLGQTLTTEAGLTTCDQDKLVATTSTSNSIPPICGSNQGQHIYIDAGNLPSDSAVLTFTIDRATSSSSRTWEIKITQILCHSELRAPDGCLQYYVGPVGRITSFNFLGDHHLQLQAYSACIRQEEGFCCIEYSVCSDTGSFSIDGGTTALVDTACTGDFIRIDGARASCSQGENHFNRFCGLYFSTFATQNTKSENVCDCSAPFSVGIHTDAAVDDTTDLVHKGVCLNYNQVPC